MTAHQGPNRWLTLLICIVFLAIQISGAHAHLQIAVSHSEFAVADSAESHAGAPHQIESGHIEVGHIEVGLFHLDHSNLHDHDLGHGDHPATPDHVDITLDVHPDALSKSSLLSQASMAVLTTLWLWHLHPATAAGAPNCTTLEKVPARPSLRPPICGPPSSSIV